jgi:hypothetical protein
LTFDIYGLTLEATWMQVVFFFTRNDSQLERAQTGRLPPPLVRRDGGARPGEGRHRPAAPLRGSPLQRQGSPPGGVFRLV